MDTNDPQIAVREFVSRASKSSRDLRPSAVFHSIPRWILNTARDIAKARDRQRRLQLARRLRDLLNDLNQKDPKAVAGLINSRVSCNNHTASHPTVEVGVAEDGTGYTLGTLGFLQALIRESAGVQPDDFCLVAVYDTDRDMEFKGEILRFFISQLSSMGSEIK